MVRSEIEQIDSGESLRKERLGYVDNINRLESTSGWNKLSDSQRRVIRLSMYVNDRAKRIGDYSLSRNYVNKMLCHTAVMAVETADIDEFDGNDLPEHVDKQFFVEEKIPMFNNPKAYEDLRVAISTSEFPIVVQPGFSPKLGSFPHANHSFIVFGADSEGEIVCWDKQGWGLDSPFRVISFDEIYDKYKQSSYWGIRQLRNLTAVQKWNLEDIQIPQAKRTSFWSLFKSNNN